MKKASSSHTVCFITSVHSPFDVRIFYREAVALRESGYFVYVIAQHRQRELVDGITILPLPRFRNRLARMLFGNLKSIMTSLKMRADVYRLHDPELIFTALLLKYCGKKVIYDHHDDVVKFIMIKDYISVIFRRFLSSVAAHVLQLSLKHFDYVIAATDDIRDALRAFTPSNKVVSLTNYPELRYFTFSRKRKKKETGCTVLYIGSITEDRGACQIVGAMAHVPSKVKLVLMGRCVPERLLDKLRTQDRYDRVTYLGYMDFRQAIEHSFSANIGFVCLQPVEQYLSAMPNKLFEYMALSLPVVASSFPLWKEIVEGNACGICVDPTNPRDIAQAITFLCENPDIRKRMGENGRGAAVSKYNWGIESEKLLSVYRMILNHGKEECASRSSHKPHRYPSSMA